MKPGPYRPRNAMLASWLALCLIPACTPCARAQDNPNTQKPVAAPGPMLSQGLWDLDTPQFTLRLVRSSQTVAALLPKGAAGFDFTPATC